MNNNSTIALIPSWGLVKMPEGDYSIPYTHFTYLEFICQRYKNVILIAGISPYSESCDSCYRTGGIANLKVVEMPRYSSYLSAITHFETYYRAFKKVRSEIDLVYCRVPDPFSWMPRLIFRKKCIMHFVGDAIDATKHNEDWSKWKKRLMIAGYLPDYLMTILAAKKSTVYTNGHHLAKRLSTYGIKATAVVSSTIREASLIEPTPLPSVPPIHLIYVGYIRFAKGMHCLMHLCELLKQEEIPFHFDIVGNGEMYDEVREFIIQKGLTDNVTLHGHVDDRNRMNNLLRQSNLFFFPSLSEGSPRVVVEAMSQGIPVVTTPVGALPFSFSEGETIRFFNFDDAKKACEIIKEYLEDPTPFLKIRDKAYLLVKEKYTIEKFLSKVFTYEE